AGAPENAGEDIRRPIDHEGVVIAACGDQSDVFGDRGVGGARPLAIDDFMEVVGGPDVGGLQRLVSLTAPLPLPARDGGRKGKVYSRIKRGERLRYQKPARDKL